MKPVTYLPAVHQELSEAVDHYERRQRGLGEQFFESYLKAIDTLREIPHTGFPSAAGTRSLRIRHFPFGIVFKELEDRVLVIALYHFSRRPDYWHDRLSSEELR